MFAWLRRKADKVDTAAKLAEFLNRRASLIAQKSVVGYCEVKTMLPLHELLKDKPFVDAFEVARWEALIAALADLTVVAEGYLRDATESRNVDLAGALAALYGKVLGGHPIPAERAARLAADVEGLRQRLATARERPPLPIQEISKISARRLYATMPIHERLREPDEPAITANVQFLMVGMAHEFQAQLDCAAIVADLRQANANASRA